MTVQPDVDVIVAVHQPTRPVERAVASVLEGTRSAARVTVVCHNTRVDPIRDRLGRWAADPRVRILHLDDQIASPSGPFNLGLERATAEFTSVMGSDDTLQPGAVDSWLALAATSGADVVITRLRHPDGASVPTPPTRPGRVEGLDGVRDRLSYRSAPLGLVRRSRFGHLRFTPDLSVGEDIAYVSQLWFSGRQIVYDRTGPAYVIGADASDRVTLSPRPVADELAYVEPIVTAAWFRALDVSQRRALVAKLLRVQVFGAVARRADPDWWTPAERAGLAARVRALLGAERTTRRVLSRADLRAIAVAADPTSPTDTLLDAVSRRARYARPHALLTARVCDLLLPDSPLRFVVASWLAGRG